MVELWVHAVLNRHRRLELWIEAYFKAARYLREERAKIAYALKELIRG